MKWEGGEGGLKGRTLGHQGARHSSTNHMHHFYYIFSFFVVYEILHKFFTKSIVLTESSTTSSSFLSHSVLEHQMSSSVAAASGWSWSSMHQRCVRSPARGAQCECVLPSVGCPVPSQGSLLDPRSRAQKGQLVRKARPSQAAGLPHFARVRTGRFPFLFLLQDLSHFPVFNSSPRFCFLSPKKIKDPLSRDGGLSFHRPSRTVPALEMLPAPDIEQILETLPLFGDRPKNNGGQRDGWSAATWT